MRISNLKSAFLEMMTSFFMHKSGRSIKFNVSANGPHSPSEAIAEYVYRLGVKRIFLCKTSWQTDSCCTQV